MAVLKGAPAFRFCSLSGENRFGARLALRRWVDLSLGLVLKMDFPVLFCRFGSSGHGGESVSNLRGSRVESSCCMDRWMRLCRIERSPGS